MLKQKNKKFSTNNKKAQTLLEYTIVLGLVVAVLSAMAPMLQRGVQAMIRLVADQVGNQQNAEQVAFRQVNGVIPEEFSRQGFLEESYSSVQSSMRKERIDDLGVVSYLYDDETETETDALVNLGFSPTN